MRWFAMVALAFAGACGGDDGHPADGTWLQEVGNDCFVAFTFTSSDRQYVNQIVCELEGGSIGSEVESGTTDFTVPGTVTMTPRKTSCPNSAFSDHKPVTWTYSITGKSISFMDSSGVGTYQRIDDDPTGEGGNSILFGCWAKDLSVFQRHPLQNL